MRQPVVQPAILRQFPGGGNSGGYRPSPSYGSPSYGRISGARRGAIAEARRSAPSYGGGPPTTVAVAVGYSGGSRSAAEL